jgi:antitoxin ChpS
MLAVPPALLDLLQLQPGSTVGLAVKGGSLIVHPILRPRYTLEELLGQCHPKVRRKQKDREWFDAKPVGRELI